MTTLIVHEPNAPSVPPVRLIIDVPAFAVMLPLQSLVMLTGVATFSAAGMVSVKVTPLRAALFGLLIVKVIVVEPFTGIVVGTNPVRIVGGFPNTLRSAVLLGLPLPLSSAIGALV